MEEAVEKRGMLKVTWRSKDPVSNCGIVSGILMNEIFHKKHVPLFPPKTTRKVKEKYVLCLVQSNARTPFSQDPINQYYADIVWKMGLHTGKPAIWPISTQDIFTKLNY